MVSTLSLTTDDAPVQALITQPYPTFTKLAQIPYRPWVMEGVEYKLMSVDKRSGGFTCMLRVAAEVKAPVHHHMGGIEVFVVSGDICYTPEDMGGAGDYIFEPAGDIHEPKSPNGCELFCVFYGPIAGLDDAGAMVGVVDAKLMLQMANEHGVAAHVRQ
ncbi:MAG: 2,4'-dihydroxyacetophenone dioxygenase family protein [Pseudomonadota bacterium]